MKIFKNNKKGMEMVQVFIPCHFSMGFGFFITDLSQKFSQKSHLLYLN